MEKMWVNPFESDLEEQQEQSPTVFKKKSITTPRAKKTPKASKGKKTPSILPPESDSEEEIPCTQPPKKKRTPQFPDSEDELEPVRASPLKSFFSRRCKAGSSFQADPSRPGKYYVEIRISNAHELEARQLSAKDQCKLSLINAKIRVDPETAVWKSVSKLVTDTKEQFKTIRPVLYPSNID